MKLETPRDQSAPAVRDERDTREWALIAGIGRGDAAAFATLYKLYFEQLYRFIFKMTRRLDLIEDVINEVMLAVWQQAAGVVPRSRASTWIFGIAHYKVLQALAKAGRVMPAPDEDSSPNPASTASPEQSLENEQLFVRALEHLSPEQRSVLELVYYQELHYDEIAVMLDIPANTVKTRVFHARRKLREVWPALAGRLRPES